MKFKRYKFDFNSPLQNGDTATNTYGCRLKSPDILTFTEIMDLKKFVHFAKKSYLHKTFKNVEKSI